MISPRSPSSTIKCRSNLEMFPLPFSTRITQILRWPNSRALVQSSDTEGVLTQSSPLTGSWIRKERKYRQLLGRNCAAKPKRSHRSFETRAVFYRGRSRGLGSTGTTEVIDFAIALMGCFPRRSCRCADKLRRQLSTTQLASPHNSSSPRINDGKQLKKPSKETSQTINSNGLLGWNGGRQLNLELIIRGRKTRVHHYKSRILPILNFLVPLLGICEAWF